MVDTLGLTLALPLAMVPLWRDDVVAPLSAAAESTTPVSYQLGGGDDA
jgi:hypothetical protein